MCSCAHIKSRSFGLASLSPTITGPAHVHTQDARKLSANCLSDVAVMLIDTKCGFHSRRQIPVTFPLDLTRPSGHFKRFPFRSCVRPRVMLNDNHTSCERLASFRTHIRAGLERKSTLKCRGGWGKKAKSEPITAFQFSNVLPQSTSLPSLATDKLLLPLQYRRRRLFGGVGSP